MKSPRLRQSLQSEKMVCSPLQGTRNRRRSEMLLSHTRSDLRLPNQANSRIKDLRSRRVISFPSFETSAAKNGVLDSKNGGIECTPPRSNVVGEQHCDGSVSLGKTEGKNETMKSGIGSDAVSEEKVDNVQNSRLKLYSNSSNSHCYRRLLPYLKDITAHNSATLEILPCQNRFVNLHKFPREGSVDSEKEVLNFSTDSSQNTGEIAENKSTKVSCNGQGTGEIETNPCIVLEDYVRNNQNTDAGVTAEHKTGRRMLLEHPTNKSDDIGATSPDSFVELESSVSNGQDMRVTPIDPSTSIPDNLPTTPTSEILTPVRCSTISPLKGILKREKRKCRGACTCLKCVSFLLNAEKAFEFSKVQLLNAEGVALGLMKELSALRKMVVDSTIPVAGSGGRSILDHNQVQAICRRSSRAEQLARSQLKKMTSDLEIHCSKATTKSRVTFADSVEERIFTQ